ncbi:hypothetical protein [Campylobacter geochelonis]|uniref:hypothetical protein n=1 Tax=Campylobacter geochelonis TaxID=1780362 RepID=UPI00077075D9|nr:hypothetical protein [Campylobacter geochelonis]CZE50834.1 Uncharacterised protein [Campylobacter geochelonis]
MEMIELRKKDFLNTITPDEKKIVQEAIEIYDNFIDCKDAIAIKKAVHNGTMKKYSAEEVYTKLGLNEA